MHTEDGVLIKVACIALGGEGRGMSSMKKQRVTDSSETDSKDRVGGGRAPEREGTGERHPTLQLLQLTGSKGRAQQLRKKGREIVGNGRKGGDSPKI